MVIIKPVMKSIHEFELILINEKGKRGKSHKKEEVEHLSKYLFISLSILR
jgi:hypothetical protein